MKTPILLFLLSVAMLLTSFGQVKSEDAKHIQGTWALVKAELGGQLMKDDVWTKITLKLNSGKYELTAENTDKGTYTIDPSAKPKTLDITGTEGPNVGKTIPAIYELDGDTLRVCYGLGGAPRPTEFKSPTGTKIFL